MSEELVGASIALGKEVERKRILELIENSREDLAELEHQQWESWSKYVAENNDIPKELKEKWKKNWKPYSELDEKTKDSDRIWADKIIEKLKQRITENKSNNG